MRAACQAFVLNPAPLKSSGLELLWRITVALGPGSAGVADQSRP